MQIQRGLPRHLRPSGNTSQSSQMLQHKSMLFTLLHQYRQVTLDHLATPHGTNRSKCPQHCPKHTANHNGAPRIDSTSRSTFPPPNSKISSKLIRLQLLTVRGVYTACISFYPSFIPFYPSCLSHVQSLLPLLLGVPEQHWLADSPRSSNRKPHPIPASSVGSTRALGHRSKVSRTWRFWRLFLDPKTRGLLFSSFS